MADEVIYPISDGTGQDIVEQLALIARNVSYTLPEATPTTVGGIRYDGRTLMVNSAGQLYVAYVDISETVAELQSQLAALQSVLGVLSDGSYLSEVNFANGCLVFGDADFPKVADTSLPATVTDDYLIIYDASVSNDYLVLGDEASVADDYLTFSTPSESASVVDGYLMMPQAVATGDYLATTSDASVSGDMLNL